ncbi:amino acid ABC transporter substrate-binding protein [Parvibium lacunae]|nr:amino acid ABC transporter substrate-binding protein [Parvibium lacunae]
MMHRHVVRPWALGIIALFSAAAVAQTPTLDRIRQTGVITIAHRESSLPFSFLDQNKKPIGYAVDVCLKAADAVKRELKLKELRIEWMLVTPKNRIEMIQQGKADMECGSTTNNRERREKVAFTIPHYIAGARILVKKSSGITSLEGLRGKTVVTTKGTTTVKILRAQDDQRVLKLNLVEADDHAQSFKMVEEGKADAFAMDDVLLFSLRAQAANPTDFEVVGDYLSIEPLAIMLSKDDAAFKKIVDREVTRLIVDFEMQALYKKWFLEPIPPKGINLKIPMSYLLRDSFRFPTDKVND